MNRHISAAQQMEDFGRTLAACSKERPVFITLQGPLGTGKTTLVRGFLYGLGYQGAVKSPTYTLVEPYQIAQKDIYHFDFYRINDPEELEDIGIRDYFDGQHTCLIEWPENAQGLLPQPDLAIQIAYQDEARDLSIKACTSQGEGVLKALEDQI